MVCRDWVPLFLHKPRHLKNKQKMLIGSGISNRVLSICNDNSGDTHIIEPRPKGLAVCFLPGGGAPPTVLFNIRKTEKGYCFTSKNTEHTPKTKGDVFFDIDGLLDRVRQYMVLKKGPGGPGSDSFKAAVLKIFAQK